MRDLMIIVLEATRWLCEVDTRHVDAPALIFAVRADPLVPLKGTHALAEAIGAPIVTLENTGHGIPLNPVWANVTAQIDPWLRTMTAQRSDSPRDRARPGRDQGVAPVGPRARLGRVQRDPASTADGLWLRSAAHSQRIPHIANSDNGERPPVSG
jgi:hypothetical protein